LYPNAQGITVDKFNVIKMVELLARKLHLPIVGQDSRKAYGGHVVRVSGARQLAKKGMAVAILAQVQRFRHFRDAMVDPLTVHLASFLDDDTLVPLSSTCVINLTTLTVPRDAAVNRACCTLLNRLSELDDEFARADAEDTAYWWAHVAADWEDSD